MAVTSFKFPPLFRKPKIVEFPKRLGVRAVEVDSSNNFFLTLQDILNPDLNFMFGKMQVIKKYSRFSRFLLLQQDFFFYNHKLPKYRPVYYIFIISLTFTLNIFELKRAYYACFCSAIAQLLTYDPILAIVTQILSNSILHKDEHKTMRNIRNCHSL